MAEVISFGILTVSDRCYEGSTEDKSGPALRRAVETAIPSAKVQKSECVPDEEERIIHVLKQWTEPDGIEALDVVLTTGGTGFALRDVTPEATRRVIHKEAPALAVAMTVKSLEVTPLAALSRAVCGVTRGGSLIVNLPGSPKGAQECFHAISMAIPHAVAVARGKQAAVAAQHSALATLASPQQSRHSCSHSSRGASAHGAVDVPRGDGDSKAALAEAMGAPLARRPRSSLFPMVSVENAQLLIRQHLQNVTLGEESVPLAAALGRVLARSVHATRDLPPFPASLKDGYAVRSADGSGPRSVVAVSAAGHESRVPPGGLQSGQCVRINTGAAVPPGADAVVQVEDTRLLKETLGGTEELEVEILVAPSAGLDIRPTGSDVRRGQQVLPAGCLLSPSEVGLVAGAGLVCVPVRALPTIALLSTGDELIDATGETSGVVPDGIPDTNRPTLKALLQQHGFTAVVDLGIARDSRESMKENLERGLSSADVLVTSGSVSMGDRDFLKQILLQDFKADIIFGRVNMKPGKPTTFAVVQHRGKKRFVVGLPGNPVSATVTSHLFLLPLLKQLAEHPQPMPTKLRATVEGEFCLDPRPEYHRVSLTWRPDTPLPVARSTGSQASSRLLSMSGANALAVLPGAVAGTSTLLPRGSTVDVVLLREL